jgi:hypothetical protein
MKIRSVILSPISWVLSSLLIAYILMHYIHGYQYQLARPSFFLGTWQNSTNTDSFTKLIIQNDSKMTFQLHLFASCIPVYCDWGVTKGYYLNGHIHGNFTFSYKTTDIDLSITNEGMLKVVQINNYFDPVRERQKISIPPSILVHSNS